jgi:glucokinase
MTQKIVAGIDIGGTNTKFGLVDQYGKILSHKVVPTTDYEEATDFAHDISERILKEASLFTDADLEGVGIGVPNGNYYRGSIEFAPNLKWKGVVPLAKYFHQETGLPVALTNDAKAAALGEMIFGGAKNMKDFIFITLGTGLGSGIVVDGKLVYGHDGFAGEMGHTIVVENGRLCGCGRRGCLEQYVSATAMRINYLELLQKAGKKPPENPDTIDSKFVFEAAEANDQVAKDAFEFTGKMLGLALANACCFTSPEAIFLFGGLAQSGDYILEPVKRHFDEMILAVYKGKVQIQLSQLKESDAAILGAASLIWNDLKKIAQ